MVGSGHFDCLCHIRFKVSATIHEKLFKSASNHGDGVCLAHKERTGKQYLYVFGNLMSQGNITETIGQQVGPKEYKYECMQ
jgi:hypothetical protein